MMGAPGNFHFTHEGKTITLRVDTMPSGLEVHLVEDDDSERSLCYIDLWTFAKPPNGEPQHRGMPPHAILVIDDGVVTDDCVGLVHYLPQGTLVELDQRLKEHTIGGTVMRGLLSANEGEVQQ